MKVKCDIFAKVVGYCRKIANWNEGKKQEMKDRKFSSLKDLAEENEYDT